MKIYGFRDPEDGNFTLGQATSQPAEMQALDKRQEAFANLLKSKSENSDSKEESIIDCIGFISRNRIDIIPLDEDTE